MLFNSPQFAIFLAVTFVAFLASPLRYRMQVLLVASLAFYGLWVPSYLLLLFGTLGVNYVLLRRAAASARSKAYLVTSIVFTLLLLGIFKYAAFVVQSLSPLLRGVLHLHPRTPDLVLPLGISFYSFEIISIAVDVHRRRMPCPSLGRYVLFVTFFPHLIAGPILRGNELIPQFDALGERTPERTRRGLWLVAVGLAKKTILSDFLLLPFVGEVFGAPGGEPGPAHVVAAYSFAFQIYFDFSGYSDMARGLACLFGIELPMNFEEPYLSRDPSEFWQRWHMTLSRWLRDYLYVPLGGNRGGNLSTLRNLVITMVLGGLWHGAGLNFVLWGVLHGLLLVAYRLLAADRRSDAPLAWSDVPRIFLLFQLVCLVWVPFRAPTFGDTVAFYRGLFNGGYLRSWPILPTAVVALAFALHGLERAVRPRLPRVHAAIAGAAWGPLLEGGLLGAIVCAALLASGAGVEFIYFQF